MRSKLGNSLQRQILAPKRFLLMQVLNHEKTPKRYILIPRLTWDLRVTLSRQSKNVSLFTGSTGLSRMLLTAYKAKQKLL